MSISTSGSKKSFPKQKKSFAAKGMKWRQEHLDWADQNSFLNNGTVRRKLKNRRINLNLYNGKADINDMKLILNPGGMEEYYIPDNIQHYPIITPRVNVLVGEEKRRKFDWSVKITNPDTISQIKNDKKKLVDAKLQEFLSSTLSDEELTKAIEAYGDYINYDYQDVREKRANLLMRHYISKLEMKVLFQQGFKDALIMGEEIYIFDIVNGAVTFEKLNPLNVHTLRGGYSNKIEDSDVIVIDEFWSPGRVQDHFYEDLKAVDIDKLDNGVFYGSQSDLDGENVAIDDVAGLNMLNRESINAFIDSTGLYDSAHSAGRNEYTDSQGNLRVLRMFWRSMKCIYKVDYFDDLGKIQTKFRSEDYVLDKAKGETGKKLWVTQWWKGAKVGKDIYLQIKPREIQYNKINQPSFNSCGIVGQIYNTTEQEAVSMVDRSKPFQYLYDISWYRVNEALSKYLGSIVELDLAKVPTGWSVTKWLYFARKSGISVVDSFKEGQKGMAKGKLAGAVGNTTGKVLEQRVGDFIQVHMDMMEFAKAQMDEITGVSRQRLGQVENRETVGGIERAVSQSNHITEELFTLHDYCKKRCFQILIETAKIALKGNSVKFSYIADDMTRQIMEIDGDEFAEEEYGLEVSNDDAINEMQQKLDGMVQMGLQNQMLSFSTAMKIYNSPSLREVQRLIEKDEQKMRESQAKASEDEMKQRQAEAEAMAQKEQIKQTIDIEKFNKEDETKRYIAELKAETDRINKDNSEKGMESIDADDDDFKKFEAELGIKKQGLSQDMKKHNDIMSRKDREIEIKNKIANKKPIISK
jgi:environmental stress-induced protein Ves